MRRCFCGRAGTVRMVPPDCPTQANDNEGYYLCADHALACKFLVPAEEVLTQQEMDKAQQSAWTRTEGSPW